MENATELLNSLVPEGGNDIPYRENLTGKIFIADSEQEATARFDEWMNDRSDGKRNLVGVYDQSIGSNICVITAVYWIDTGDDD